MKHLIFILLTANCFAQSQQGTGPLQYIKDKKNSYVLFDSITPSNNSGLPVNIVGGAVITNYALESGGHLQAIDLKLPSLGQSTMSASLPVTFASNQTQLGVNVQASVLPTNAASNGEQLVQSTSLASIVTNTTGKATESTLANVATNVQTIKSTVASDGASKPGNSLMVAGNDGTNLRPLNTDSSGKLNVNIGSISLPAGASTSALQTSGNSLLSSIDTKLTSPLAVTSSALTDSQLRATAVPVSISSLPIASGAATSALQSTGNSSLSNIDTKTPSLVSGRVPVDGSGVTQPISVSSLPLPTSASTSALQTSGNTSLSSIDTKLSLVSTESTLSSINNKLPTSVGQKTSANSLSVVISSDQSNVGMIQNAYLNGTQVTGNVSTAITLTAPSNSIGFILQASDINVANLRYAIGSTATASSGMQLQAGRDTGFVPISANVSIVSETGTNEYQIQWVIK